MTVLVFYNFLLILVAFSVMMLFSALFEYGAYIQAKDDETSRIQEEMIVSFAEITENKSSQTGNHVKRVSEYSQIIAKQMELPEEQCERIRPASTTTSVPTDAATPKARPTARISRLSLREALRQHRTTIVRQIARKLNKIELRFSSDCLNSTQAC